jgi:hypothetical protein
MWPPQVTHLAQIIIDIWEVKSDHKDNEQNGFYYQADEVHDAKEYLIAIPLEEDVDNDLFEYCNFDESESVDEVSSHHSDESV